MAQASNVRDGALTRAVFAVGAALLLAACAAPVGVSRVSPRTVTHELTRSALNSATPSAFSQNVLHRWNLTERFRRDPEGVLAELHQLVVRERGRDQTLFALAELSFLHADDTRKQDYYFQSAVSAWAFLFPGGDTERPDEFDPRLRIAADLYSRALTTNIFVQTLARFVTLPVDVLGATADLLEGNRDALLVDPRGPRFGSVYGMRPGRPFLEALAATPIAPGIAAHSIIPVKGDSAGDNATDGVVTFRSARIDGVESELVIPFSGHSVQGQPLAVEEVRRILLDHAMAVCKASGVACGPPRAFGQGLVSLAPPRSVTTAQLRRNRSRQRAVGRLECLHAVRNQEEPAHPGLVPSRHRPQERVP